MLARWPINWPGQCAIPPEAAGVQSAVAGDLTSSTVITVNPLAGAGPITSTPRILDTVENPDQGATTDLSGVRGIQQTQSQNNPPKSLPPNRLVLSTLATNAPGVASSVGLAGSLAQPQRQPPASVLAIIYSMIGGALTLQRYKIL